MCLSACVWQQWSCCVCVCVWLINNVWGGRAEGEGWWQMENQCVWGRELVWERESGERGRVCECEWGRGKQCEWKRRTESSDFYQPDSFCCWMWLTPALWLFFCLFSVSDAEGLMEIRPSRPALLYIWRQERHWQRYWDALCLSAWLSVCVCGCVCCCNWHWLNRQ